MTTEGEDTQRLWNEFRTRLLAYVRRRVPSAADAEDIVQDVFLRLHRNGAARAAIRDPEAWLHRVAANALKDRYRQRGAERTAMELLSRDPTIHATRDEPGAAAGGSGLAGCVEPLISSLPGKYREALRAVSGEATTQAAAARKLGLSESSMKSRVQRGRGKLRDALLACCRVELDRRNAVIDYEPRAGSGCRTCDGGRAL